MTSISTADDYAGSAAFDLLLNRIEGRENGPFKRLASPVQLISRDSTIEQNWRTA
jgi:DNA-binding LacI/PurR family transcriptional regulator